eukprot:PhF_6_TR6215/c0_g1_i1/m.9365
MYALNRIFVTVTYPTRREVTDIRLRCFYYVMWLVAFVFIITDTICNHRYARFYTPSSYINLRVINGVEYDWKSITARNMNAAYCSDMSVGGAECVPVNITTDFVHIQSGGNVVVAEYDMYLKGMGKDAKSYYVAGAELAWVGFQLSVFSDAGATRTWPTVLWNSAFQTPSPSSPIVLNNNEILFTASSMLQAGSIPIDYIRYSGVEIDVNIECSNLRQYDLDTSIQCRGSVQSVSAINTRKNNNANVIRSSMRTVMFDNGTTLVRGAVPQVVRILFRVSGLLGSYDPFCLFCILCGYVVLMYTARLIVEIFATWNLTPQPRGITSPKPKNTTTTAKSNPTAPTTKTHSEDNNNNVDVTFLKDTIDIRGRVSKRNPLDSVPPQQPQQQQQPIDHEGKTAEPPNYKSNFKSTSFRNQTEPYEVLDPSAMESYDGDDLLDDDESKHGKV